MFVSLLRVKKYGKDTQFQMRKTAKFVWYNLLVFGQISWFFTRDLLVFQILEWHVCESVSSSIKVTNLGSLFDLWLINTNTNSSYWPANYYYWLLAGFDAMIHKWIHEVSVWQQVTHLVLLWYSSYKAFVCKTVLSGHQHEVLWVSLHLIGNVTV